MKYCYFTFFSLCIYFGLTIHLQAQIDGHIYKGIILDKKTDEPLAFVSIVNKMSNQGTYSNEEGRFQINLPNQQDSVLFTCIGYKSKEIKVSDLYIDKQNSILLEPETYSLESIIIKPSNRRTTVGYTKMKKHGLTLTSAPSTHQYAVFIPNEGYYGQLIEKLIYNTTRLKYHYKVALKLHLYEKDKKTVGPGKELLKENMIVKLGSKRTFEVNVLEQRIVFPKEGVFVGLEWVGRIDKKTGKYKHVSERAEPGASITYDVGEERTWSTFGAKPWILSQDPTRIAPNVMFGLTLLDQK